MTSDYEIEARVRDYRQRKHDRFSTHFDAKLLALGLGPYSVEGCELILKFLNEATAREWKDVADAIAEIIGEKVNPPKSTIGWLRRTYERRLRAAKERG
jgi:hypothetical protein